MADFTEISARENKLVKQVKHLQSSARARREAGLFVLEGLRICDDARENGVVFERFIVSKTAMEKYPEEIKFFAECSLANYVVTDPLFKTMADTDSPQGIMAVARIPENNRKPTCHGRYIALENIADPSNLGAVARTAEALGVDGIILTDGGCDPYSPKSLRASMGTLLRMPLFITDDICALSGECHLRTLACVPDSGAVHLGDVQFSDGDVLLIGNEANGLLAHTIEKSDMRVTIPMTGRAESLNAAAAAAIVMWEMMKGEGI